METKNIKKLKSVECPICAKSYRKSYLSIHMRIHTGEKPYKCEQCKESFTFWNDLDSHKRKHSGNTFDCKVCGWKFDKIGNLKIHEQNHRGERPYQCSVCLKTFLSSYNLKIHAARHNNERPFKCDICHKCFKVKGYLQTHIKRAHTHSEVRPFACEVCEKRFKSSGELKVHKTLLHNDTEKQHECDICKKKFRLRGDLQKHRKIHDSEKPYECDLCQKRFRTRQYFENHMIRHTGERTYKCSVCSKSFTTRSQWDIHVKRHSDLRPYQCNLCEKNFKTPDDLCSHRARIHGKQEKIFDCLFCVDGQSFKTRHELFVHLGWHVGEKHYFCRKCSAEFPSRQTRKDHFLWAHTNQRPNKCKICQKAFQRKTTCTVHQRNCSRKLP